MTPLVSITLSAYNVEQYIADSLDCLINQTYKNIEIICIDDGSNDNTLNILQQYALKDNRIRVVAKPKNEGLAVARNQSLIMAKGKYVTFLDGDDLFDLTMIEKAVKKAESNNADMVIWDYAIFYDEKEIDTNKNKLSDLINIDRNDKIALLKRPAFTGIKLLKTDVVKRLGIHFPKGLTRQDIPVHWHLITSIENISLLPERLYYYRQQPQATTAKTDKRLFDLATVMDITKKYLSQNNLYKDYQDLFLEYQLNFLAGMYDKVDNIYKDEAMTIIDNIINAEHRNYIKHNKPLRWQSKLFYNGIFGSKIAKIKLSLWYLIRKVYRKIKSFV